MAERIIAVLVQDQNEVFGPLRLQLHQQGIPICLGRSCAELLPLLTQHDCQQMVFSDTSLPDGTWADVLAVSSRSRDFPVIVVSRLVDVRLYMDALERGAFDFIVPPFNAADLEHIVRCVPSREGPPHGQERGSGKVVESSSAGFATPVARCPALCTEASANASRLKAATYGQVTMVRDVTAA